MAAMLNALLKTGLSAGRLLDRVVNDSPLGDPNFRGDRYIEYDRLLKKGPLRRSFVSGGWAVLGYQAVQDGLKDPQRFSADLRNSPTISRLYRLTARDARSALLDNPTLLNTDPPDHTRLRKLARTGFLRTFVASLEPKIRTIVDECLGRLGSRDEFDLIEALARPLPARLISDILGVEPAERDRFRHLSEEILRNIGVFDVDALSRLNDATQEVMRFMGSVADRKRTEPGNDIISALIAADQDGERLSPMEVTMLSGTLMTAGYETTMRLIGNAVYLLLCHQTQLNDVRVAPSLLVNVVEETLRFEPPAQVVGRVARDDMEFYDCTIKKGQTVAFIPAAANRDPEANDQPGIFDIHRKEIKHVSFGYGIHLCLGAELARLESRIALEMLFERYPRIELAQAEPNWETSYTIRGLKDLFLRVG